MSTINNRAIAYLGFLFFSILLALSLYFWQERVLIMDAAYQVFCVITRETLAIQVERFGAAVVQYIPLLMARNNVALPTILMTYSAAFVVYPMLAFALLITWVRNYRMGLALMLFFGLLQVHTFYWIQSELIQGCVFSLFLLGLYSQWPRLNGLRVVAYAFMTIVVVYAHPLAITALVFGLGYFYIDDERYRKSAFWYLLACIVVVMGYKYFLSTIGQYDQTAIAKANGMGGRLLHFFELSSVKAFGSRLLSTYFLLLPAIAALIYLFVREKQFWKLAWTMTAIIAWLILILTTHHWGVEQFYIESFYLMLGVFVGLPLAWDAWIKLSKWWMGPVLLVMVMGVRIGQIWEAKSAYVQRLEWHKEMLTKMEQYPEQRFYIWKKDVPMYLLQYIWATPFESMMLSSIQDKHNPKTLYVMDDEDEKPDYLIYHLQDIVPTKMGFWEYAILEKRFPFHNNQPLRLLE